jgi:hypothetical protein
MYVNAFTFGVVFSWLLPMPSGPHRPMPHDGFTQGSDPPSIGCPRPDANVSSHSAISASTRGEGRPPSDATAGPLDGSLSSQPHGGITVTTRMRAYRQASRRVASHLLRSAATVACVHGGPDRTHVGRARNESGYRLSYKTLVRAVTPGITLGGCPDVRPRPPVSSWTTLHGTHGRWRACRGLGSRDEDKGGGSGLRLEGFHAT